MANPTDPELPAQHPVEAEPGLGGIEPAAPHPTDSKDDGAEELDLDWRRPHPLTILIELGRAIRSIVIALVVVGGGVLNQAAFLEAALLIAPFAGAVGRWYTTRYAIGEESVHLHHGLFWRTKQVLPRANIQNVSTKAGLLARMGSVVDLQISDASASGDIRLRVITQDEADRLTTLLRSSMQSVPAPGSDPSSGAVVRSDHAAPTSDPTPRTGDIAAPAPGGPAVERAPLVAPSLRPLLIAEVSASSTVMFMMVATIAASAFTLIVWMDRFALDFGALPFSVSAWMVLLAGLGAALVLAGIGVVQRLLALGGFRLWADPDRLRIKVGLLTEARIAARRERIQQIRVERDLLHQTMGIERVGYETADVEVEGTAGTRFLAPVAPAGTWRELGTEVFGDVQLTELDLQRVSPLTMRRIFLRFVFVAVPMVVLALVNPAVPTVIIPWLAGGWIYSRKRYQALGYARSTDQFLVRSGVFYGRLTLVRLDKVQSVWLRSTIFQRRLGLSTLMLSTAGRGFGGLVSLPDLPNHTADELMTALARRAALTPIADTL